MELLKIVDENGIFTGTIMEKGKAHDLNLLHWEVGTFIINNQRQVLLQKRSANKRFGANLWGLCAGHVKADEEIEEAAIRELKEEVGLQVTTEDLHILEKMEVNIKDINSQLLRYYYIICNKKEFEFTIQEEELSAVKWFDIDEILNLVRNHDDITVFKEDRIYLLERIKQVFNEI